jgi:hypothetical protein
VTTPPALSIVVTGRNDNYGGDFNERFLATLRFNHARLAEQHVASEVVFVEWNPVPDRPLLADVLARDCPDVPLRSFVVAPQYQTALTQNPAIGYLEFVAKNVGLRRASAPLVLSTNTDVFLGREVVNGIAGALAPGTVYRAARYDVKLGADRTRVTWNLLEDPASHVRRPVLTPPLLGGGTGDFVLADRQVFHDLRGFNEVYRLARAGPDLNLLVKAHGAGFPIADIGGPVYHFNHVGSFRISKSLYGKDLSQTAWGGRWHARNVVYDNPENWGLRDAPTRTLANGVSYLDFDWRAVPPLVELRRVILPVRQADVESV